MDYSDPCPCGAEIVETCILNHCPLGPGADSGDTSPYTLSDRGAKDAQMADVIETCRWCDMPIAFRRGQHDEWDWVALTGKPWCTASSNCRHHPVNPVEGIDY